MDNRHNCTQKRKSRKHLWITFLMFFLFTSSMMQANDDMFAQTKITAIFTNTNLNEVLWEIQKQSDFKFIYSTSDVNDVAIKNLTVKNEVITSVLDKCLKNSGLTYSVHDGVIAIAPN